jgi:DNA-binding transcriptional regulator YdaS (Cro superfamily)
MSIMSAPERAVVAAAIGVNEQYLYQCLTRRRPTPPERCPAIERATSGKVTCEELRPDVRWHRVADPEWPHAAGRPCIDVAGPQEVEAGHAAG